MDTIADHLWICVDCAGYIANGDIPEDEGVQRAIEAGIERTLPGHWVIGSEENEPFSWNACDCCGSRLGGSRISAAVIG